jgi:hypothetical protein
MLEKLTSFAGIISLSVGMTPAFAAAGSTWEVGTQPGADASRVLYIYNRNDGEAPVLRLDCSSRDRLLVTHIIKSKTKLQRTIGLAISIEGQSISLDARSEIDVLTEWNRVTHLTDAGSPFLRMLRTGSGQMKIATINGDSLLIDLANNGHKVDQAVNLCKKRT